MRRRWQAPAMNTAAGQNRKTQIDEAVVRKMLRVNPAIRAGRSTMEVKVALEGGASLISQAAPQTIQPNFLATHSAESGHELHDALNFFVSNKERRFVAALDELEAKRRQLDESLRILKGRAAGEVVAFLALLDADTLHRDGAAALAPHTEYLNLLGTSVESILATSRSRSTQGAH
ncbi:hypothetical protein KAI87_11265 [Myxococcota bacterium]|nr:hypothetical protein [Myxococcota bacterium]